MRGVIKSLGFAGGIESCGTLKPESEARCKMSKSRDKIPVVSKSLWVVKRLALQL